MSNYKLGDMRLAYKNDDGGNSFNDSLHIIIKSLNDMARIYNGLVYNQNVPQYTPFGRALMSLLTELTNPSNTSKDYVLEKVEELFNEVDG